MICIIAVVVVSIRYIRTMLIITIATILGASVGLRVRYHCYYTCSYGASVGLRVWGYGFWDVFSRLTCRV